MKILKISGVIVLVLIIIAAALLGYFYFFPKQAQNILVPEIDQLKEANIHIKGDTAFTRLNIRLKNKGVFKIHIDSLLYAVTFDTLKVLSKQQPLNIDIKAG